ncbi:MAG TPA: hypothetical protein VFH27_09015 [Longimicrobiaceae bacterium]|nr:hypothetical protein [Longimicrobiaceae bacterium]
MVIAGVRVGDASAQTPRASDAEVIAATVHSLVASLRQDESLPAGRIGFDPRPVLEPPPGGPEAWGAVRNDADTREVLRLIGAGPQDFDSAAVCSGRLPSSCHMRNGVAAFAASKPRWSGDSATLVVRMAWRSTSQKQPVYQASYAVTVRRVDGAWKPVAFRTLMIT